MKRGMRDNLFAMSLGLSRKSTDYFSLLMSSTTGLNSVCIYVGHRIPHGRRKLVYVNRIKDMR
jgi:hypothetical protein